MANDLSANPMRFDTAVPYVPGNVSISNPSILWMSNVMVLGAIWTGYAAQGNQVVMKDRNGRIIFQMTGASDLEEVRTNIAGWVEGLCADTIQGNGILLLYIK